eukprot:8737870-Alexandrium_andersonii.AAC.1
MFAKLTNPGFDLASNSKNTPATRSPIGTACRDATDTASPDCSKSPHAVTSACASSASAFAERNAFRSTTACSEDGRSGHATGTRPGNCTTIELQWDPSSAFFMKWFTKSRRTHTDTYRCWKARLLRLSCNPTNEHAHDRIATTSRKGAAYSGKGPKRDASGGCLATR